MVENKERKENLPTLPMYYVEEEKGFFRENLSEDISVYESFPNGFDLEVRAKESFWNMNGRKNKVSFMLNRKNFLLKFNLAAS